MKCYDYYRWLASSGEGLQTTQVYKNYMRVCHTAAWCAWVVTTAACFCKALSPTTCGSLTQIVDTASCIHSCSTHLWVPAHHMSQSITSLHYSFYHVHTQGNKVYNLWCFNNITCMNHLDGFWDDYMELNRFVNVLPTYNIIIKYKSNLLFSSCCPCCQGEVAMVTVLFLHLFFPLLTFLPLCSLSPVSNSFYILLLFSILLPLLPDLS